MIWIPVCWSLFFDDTHLGLVSAEGGTVNQGASRSSWGSYKNAMQDLGILVFSWVLGTNKLHMMRRGHSVLHRG